MKIFFHAPFKPLDHPHPSGDLVIARGLVDFLRRRGHRVEPAGALRTRWIYRKPWLLPRAVREIRRARRRIRRDRPDLWLTYHTYYKAPDLIGPAAVRPTGLPYAIFQGIYSTKRRRDPRTLPGFVLNRRALTAADHLFTNRKEDLINLRRLIPEARLTYVAPGIDPDAFPFDPAAREEFRREWGAGDGPVVLSAAMFRPGVKAEGLAWTIRACGGLARRGIPLLLAIAGDGREGTSLRRLADRHLPGRVRFAGKIDRPEMHRFYSAGDLFVFPGIRESLGMVYLEAQSRGLPVVAFDNGGIPEVVAHGETGLLVPPFDEGAFQGAVETLLADMELRRRMGRAAAKQVRERHDLDRNYDVVEKILARVAGWGRVES